MEPKSESTNPDDAPHVRDGVGYLPLRDRDGRVVSWAKVDPELLDQLAQWRWCLGSRGYVVRGFRSGGPQRSVMLHRAVLGLPIYGVPKVRFRNGDTTDCRRSNLRLSTRWLAEAFRMNRALSEQVEKRAMAQLNLPAPGRVA